jgi:hypothetical protein
LTTRFCADADGATNTDNASTALKNEKVYIFHSPFLPVADRIDVSRMPREAQGRHAERMQTTSGKTCQCLQEKHIITGAGAIFRDAARLSEGPIEDWNG